MKHECLRRKDELANHFAVSFEWKHVVFSSHNLRALRNREWSPKNNVTGIKIGKFEKGYIVRFSLICFPCLAALQVTFSSFFPTAGRAGLILVFNCKWRSVKKLRLRENIGLCET